MNNKNDRLAALKALISRRELGSQDEVIQAMASEGLSITQATLSRDMKKLNIVKSETKSGRFIYKLPEDKPYHRVHNPFHFKDIQNVAGFISLQFSGNMGVIRTKPGYASRIAFHIDDARPTGVLGTIAGDDTIFIVIDQNVPYSDITESISGALRNIL